jgi:hypothetical protein
MLQADIASAQRNPATIAQSIAFISGARPRERGAQGDDAERAHREGRGARGRVVGEVLEFGGPLEEVGRDHLGHREAPAHRDRARAPAHLDETQRDAARLLARLERRDLDVRRAGHAHVDRLPAVGDRAAGGPAGRDRAAARDRAEERVRELLRVRVDAGRAPAAVVHHQRVREAVVAAVGGRVGEVRRLQEAEPERAVPRAAPVLSVVEHRDAEARLGDVHPAVAGHLELRALPAGVVVRGALDVPELRAECRAARAHAAREQRAQEPLLLLPLHVGHHVEPRRAGGESVSLHDPARAPDRPLHRDLRLQGRALRDRHALRRAEDARRQLLVVAVGVPRLPAARAVLVEDELVHRERRAVLARRVREPAVVGAAQLGHAAGIVDRRPQESVRERPFALDAHGVRGVWLRRAPRVDDAHAHRRHAHREHLAFLGGERPGLRRGRRVHDDERALGRGRVRGEPRHPLLDRAHRRAPGVRHLRPRVVVHLADRAPGQDVVELVEEDELPRAVERLARGVGRARLAAGPGTRARERLRQAQLALGAAVRLLDPRLARVRAAVELQVELAVPDPHALARAPQRALGVVQVLAEVAHRPLLDARQTLAARADVRALDLLGGRPAAAIAEAVGLQVERDPRAVELDQCPHAVQELPRLDRAVVVVAGRQVREDLGAVEPAPPERDVREAVRLAPAHLVGDEGVDPCLRHDLRQARGEPEGVRQVQEPLRRRGTEARPPPCAAVQDLADEALAGRAGGVGLDPHGARGLPAPLAHALGDLREEPGRGLLDPRVVLRLAAQEVKVRVALLEPQHVREGPQALAPGLGDRPEPRGVDVRVADRVAGDGPGRPAAHQERRELRERRRARRVHRGRRALHGDALHEGAQPAIELVRPRIGLRERREQLARGVEPLCEAPDRVVHGDELRALEPPGVRLAPARVVLLGLPPEGAHAERQVAGRLDQEVERHLALGR